MTCSIIRYLSVFLNTERAFYTGWVLRKLYLKIRLRFTKATLKIRLYFQGNKVGSSLLTIMTIMNFLGLDTMNNGFYVLWCKVLYQFLLYKSVRLLIGLIRRFPSVSGCRWKISGVGLVIYHYCLTIDGSWLCFMFSQWVVSIDMNL